MPPANRRRITDVGGFRLGRRPELDGLRGLAVLVVMAYHSDLRCILRGGYLAVDLFFALSGFLITVLLLREHQQTASIHLPRFFLRRALRLFPALWVMLAACCLWAAFRTKPDRAAVIYHAAALAGCHLANWAWCWPAPLEVLSHAWSLSLEEQFYLVWPVLLFALLRGGVRPRRIGWLVAAALVGSALFRAGLFLGPWAGSAKAAEAALATRTDSLLAGCLAGLIAAAGRLPDSPGPRRLLRAAGGTSAALLLLLGLAAEPTSPFMLLGGFTLAAVAAAVLIAAVVHSPSRFAARLLGAPAPAWVGRISYGLYLWHFPLLFFGPKLIHGIVPAVRRVPYVDAPLAYVLAFAAASLSYYAVERPFLRWKERLEPRPALSILSAR